MRGGVPTGGAGDGGTEGGIGWQAALYRVQQLLSVLGQQCNLRFCNWNAQAATRTAVTVVCSGLILSTQGTIKTDMSITRQVLADPVLLGLILTAIAINLGALGLKLERRRAHQVAGRERVGAEGAAG